MSTNGVIRMCLLYHFNPSTCILHYFVRSNNLLLFLARVWSLLNEKINTLVPVD